MQFLKFVLWTWPSASADVAEFRENRVKFHQVLANSRVAGYLGSGIFQVDTAPWAGAFLFENSPWSGGHNAVFEEWYLLHGSAALDALNEGTIAGPYKESHAKFLRKDLGGECAGLYYLRSGDPERVLSGLTDCRHSAWFNKTYPTYDDLVGRLTPGMKMSNSVLWRRLLVLGPTHEFHLDVDASVALPDELKPCWVKRARIWPA
jgi:hypothetical protein